MNILLIGYSNAGKTTLATFLAQRLGMTHVPGSEWVRKRFPGPEPEDRQERAKVLSAFSIEELKREPYAAVAYIESKYDIGRGGYIIEGFRSLGDFIHLFDPRQDVVIFLTYDENPVRATAFEAGIPHIEQHLQLQIGLGLMQAEQHIHASFESFASPCHKDGTFSDMCDELVVRLQGVKAKARNVSLRTRPRAIMGASVHQRIPRPQRVRVRAQYLFNMAPEKEGLEEWGQLTEVASYVGSTVTFSVLLDSGAVFSYLPPQAFLAGDCPTGPFIDSEDLAPFECPSDLMEVSYHQPLAEQTAWVTFPRTGEQRQGQYLLTLDWVTGNDLAHVIQLDNGQLAVVPQHKVVFGHGTEPPPLPPYQKLRRTWHVTRPAKR